MKLLFIGDVAWDAGRIALEKHLPELRKTLKPDSVIVNGENSAHGAGITEKIAEWMLNDLGVDCITLLKSKSNFAIVSFPSDGEKIKVSAPLPPSMRSFPGPPTRMSSPKKYSGT